jgi:hypothetical protein
VRNLLQDHSLHYQVVVRNALTGDFLVRDVVKPGPTVLVTTAIRRLGEQFMTRLFTLEVAGDPKQVGTALRTQAALELVGPDRPDPALIALQSYLQARAPWDVVVPFAGVLAEAINVAATPRILRDFARLLSLVKAVAVLRHRHRSTDIKGRLVADLADYATVYKLVGRVYTASVGGVSEGIRAAVEAVVGLNVNKGSGEKVTLSAVAKELSLSKPSASRRIKAAVRAGWLINLDVRKNAYDLVAGEPLPERAGLPDPRAFVGCNGVTVLTASGVPPPLPEPFYDTTTDKPESTPTQHELVASPAVGDDWGVL